MLAASATDKSETQKQLLQALGRTRYLQGLEGYYESILSEYEVLLNATLTCGNGTYILKNSFVSVIRNISNTVCMTP